MKFQINKRVLRPIFIAFFYFSLVSFSILLFPSAHKNFFGYTKSTMLYKMAYLVFANSGIQFERFRCKTFFLGNQIFIRFRFTPRSVAMYFHCILISDESPWTIIMWKS